jgi:hypothetical protein
MSDQDDDIIVATAEDEASVQNKGDRSKELGKTTNDIVPASTSTTLPSEQKKVVSVTPTVNSSPITPLQTKPVLPADSRVQAALATISKSRGELSKIPDLPLVHKEVVPTDHALPDVEEKGERLKVQGNPPSHEASEGQVKSKSPKSLIHNSNPLILILLSSFIVVSSFQLLVTSY